MPQEDVPQASNADELSPVLESRSGGEADAQSWITELSADVFSGAAVAITVLLGYFGFLVWVASCARAFIFNVPLQEIPSASPLNAVMLYLTLGMIVVFC